MGVGEFEVIKEVAKHGALGLLLLAVLWSYRRDFIRKIGDTQELSDRFHDVVEKSTAAITNAAVATARQTDATHRLARTVENLERRHAGLSPGVRTPDA